MALVACSGRPLRAFDLATEKELWSFDCGKPTGYPRPDSGASVKVVANRVLVQARLHLFALDPRTGRQLWRGHIRNAPNTPKWPVSAALYHSGTECRITAAGDIAVLAFHYRLIAMNVTTGKFLWAWMPDSYPWLSNPIADEARVYCIVGRKRFPLTADHRDQRRDSRRQR